MNNNFEDLNVDEIKALAKKEYERVKKSRNYQNAWRHKNKDKVAKYNRTYQIKKTLKQLGECKNV